MPIVMTTILLALLGVLTLWLILKWTGNLDETGRADSGDAPPDARRRLRWFALVGSIVALAFVSATALLHAVQHGPIFSIERASESRLLRDAIAEHERAAARVSTHRPYTLFSVDNDALAELIRRAKVHELSDDTLRAAALLAIELGRERPLDKAYPKSIQSVGGTSGGWMDLAASAAHRSLLSRDEQMDLLNSSVRFAVRTPPRVVAGEVVPIDFLIDVWPGYAHEDMVPSLAARLGVRLFDLTLDEASIDGIPIRLAQFDEHGREQKAVFPYGIEAPARYHPLSSHPRIEGPAGERTLRVVLTAKLDEQEVQSVPGMENVSFSSIEAWFAQPWSVVLETTFELIEHGSAREPVPLVGDLGMDVQFNVWGEPPHTFWLVPARPSHSQPMPQWFLDGHILACRLEAHVGDHIFDLGPFVYGLHVPHVMANLFADDAGQAILNAPPGTVRIVLSPEPSAAALVTGPGGLLAFEPIEVPLRVTKGESEGW